MVTVYTPDAWVIVRLSGKGEVVDKVFGGWYGGYLHGDSWRLNSGITEVKDRGDNYEFVGSSGSSYTCFKDSERMTGYMASTFALLEARAIELGGSIKRITVEELDGLH